MRMPQTTEQILGNGNGRTPHDHITTAVPATSYYG
jgi:hypothetical protein